MHYMDDDQSGMAGEVFTSKPSRNKTLGLLSDLIDGMIYQIMLFRKAN